MSKIKYKNLTPQLVTTLEKLITTHGLSVVLAELAKIADTAATDTRLPIESRHSSQDIATLLTLASRLQIGHIKSF